MNCNKDCKLDMGRGCLFCGCGEHGSAESSARVCEGCFKLHETDWLADYPAGTPSDIFEVRFKNTRRGYYRNIHSLPLKRGDIVAVESSPGHDIGIVSLTGDMVARQMRRTGFSAQNGELRAIYRKAKPYDIAKWEEAIALEHSTMIRSRQIAEDLRLDMKIGDVEYQGDRIKAIFYYIADGRVDFRELIKVFASEFAIKVEMKQIGARQEAGRIGGLGSCGRELCCSSWIASFNSVTTGAARTQDISLNPQKLAGQCCKLKCCLAYELDAYIDARRSLPRVSEPLQALDGDYYLVSSDPLGGMMNFSTVKGAAVGNISLPAARVREIIEMNRRGRKPDTIVPHAPVVSESIPDFVNMVGEESITRFDRSEGSRRGGGRGRSRDRSARGGEGRRPSNGGRGGDATRPSEGGHRRHNGQEGGQSRYEGGQSRHDGRPTPRREGGSDRDTGPKREGGHNPGGGGRREGGSNPRQNNTHPRGNRPGGERDERREGRPSERRSGGTSNERGGPSNERKPEKKD